jgi:ComF family protein
VLLTSLIKNTASLLKEILAPKMCCHCETFFTFLCQNCYEQIEFGFTTFAPQQYLDELVSLGPFTKPLKSVLLSLKYQGHIEVADTLANLAYHTTYIPHCDLVTCVPAHQDRIKERGFNQSELIAKELATLLNKPFVPLLKRAKNLTAQASIQDKNERKSRQQNTMVSIDSNSSHAAKKTVLLIDDVFTTGSTINEAARVLKHELNANQVIGFTIAHA